MHAICVTSWVFQAGEGSAANLEGTVETACHICCGHREWTVSGGANSGFTGNHYTLTELITQGLPGFQLKKKFNEQKRIFILWWFTKDIQSLGANSDLTEDWTPYNSESLRHYLAQLLFSLGRDLYSTVWFFSAELGWTVPEIPKSFLKIVGMPLDTHKHTLVPLAHTYMRICIVPPDSVFNYCTQAELVKLIWGLWLETTLIFLTTDYKRMS